MARHLVLVGGGHSHIEVLRRFALDPPPDCRLTLIARQSHSIYSGMLPGVVAGRYRRDQAEIDLVPLARRAGAALLLDEMIGLDPTARQVICRIAGPVGYDLLALDIGSTGGLSVPGAADYALPVKPIDRFLDHWQALAAQPALRGRIAVVGGGAGGVELALAIRAGCVPPGPEVTLVTADELLPGMPPRARRLLGDQLRRRDITIEAGRPVTRVTPGEVMLADGTSLPFDTVLWVTGAVAPAWIGRCGLATDPDGFVAVDAGLRSISHPTVFASGDVAAVAGYRLPKAGVFAVRQGPVLASTLRRVLAGQPPIPYRPQRHWLSLISTGDGRAVATRAGWTVFGRLPWYLKDWIDRRWIARYNQPDR
ncbi:MAG TPA: FAD-dependent oxidoreductase [Stellaceae bacterium]|nr:FAD-dependent oxidoreductase [Stellaceae bacterium]